MKNVRPTVYQHVFKLVVDILNIHCNRKSSFFRVKFEILLTLLPNYNIFASILLLVI